MKQCGEESTASFSLAPTAAFLPFQIHPLGSLIISAWVPNSFTEGKTLIFTKVQSSS
jgi:hypothetical protein